MVRPLLAEQPRVELAEAQLRLGLLTTLPEQPTVADRGLEVLFTERCEHELASAGRRWQVEVQPSL